MKVSLYAASYRSRYTRIKRIQRTMADSTGTNRPLLPGDITLARTEQTPSVVVDDHPIELPVIQAQAATSERLRRPDWLRVKLPYGKRYTDLVDIIDSNRLHTVCQSARCPNMGECWTAGTATFMILGNICTRSCGFCAVKTGRPEKGLDWDEPNRVAEAARLMEIRHAVITSVNRDERKDGGAPIFADTIKRLREEIPGCTIEVLIPDFRGLWDALQIVLDARPEILNHNVETVPRLYRRVRPQADYQRSLDVLRISRKQGLRTKSGIMVGLGEQQDEVEELMDDFAEIGLNVMTIGQYLQPTRLHLPVEEFVHPDMFLRYKEIGEAKGIEHVESGPLVRSSYRAERHL